MRCYNTAPDEVIERMAEIIAKHHERLTKSDVTIGVLMVSEDADVPMPCLKHQGYEAIAIVSIVPLKRRALGEPDALIEIDQVRWDELGELEQNAVLDHELTHLAPQFKDDGELKRDSCGRPRLKIRLHDHQHGWFEEVAERHKAASQEVQQFKSLCEKVHQQWFAFAGDRASGGRNAKKGRKRSGDSFEQKVDQIFEDAGLAGKVQKNVTIKMSGRRAAQK